MGKSAPISAAQLALGLAAALALSACSMAGLPQFAPMKSKAKSPQVAAARHVPAPAVTDEQADSFEVLAFAAEPATTRPGGGLDGLITQYSGRYNVPEALVRRVIARESGYNPAARNGPHLGLMQIRHDTARSMGYGGSASGLLDAETNLKYAVKYLRGAYVVAGYNSDGAMRNYARGYYYDAKKLGLLKEVGFR